MTKHILLIGLFIQLVVISSMGQYYNQATGTEQRDIYGGRESENLYRQREQQNNIYGGQSSGSISVKNNRFFNTEVNAGDVNDIIFEDDVPSTPIDGGVGFLLAAGVGYAVRKLRKNKSKNEEK